MLPFSCVLPSEAPWRLPIEKFLPSRPWWIIILQSISWYCNFSQARQLTKAKPAGDSTFINKHLVSTKVDGILKLDVLPAWRQVQCKSLALVTPRTDHLGNHSRLPAFMPTYVGNTCQYWQIKSAHHVKCTWIHKWKEVESTDYDFISLDINCLRFISKWKTNLNTEL